MEDNSQSTEDYNYSKMQQEKEKLQKTSQQLEEHEVLLVKNEELLLHISEQSRQLQVLHKQLETERRKRYEMKKQKDELVEYYVPQFQFLLKENQELTKELNQLNRLSNLDSPTQTLSHSSSTTESDGNQEDEKQLENFLSDGGEKFDVECKPENILRKLEVVKGFILRDRAKMQVKMKRIVEEAKIMEKELLDVVKEREEQLTSTIGQFEEVKAIFNDVSSKLSLEVDSLRGDLAKEKRENLRLRHSNRTAKRIKTCSDSADVDNTDESTLSASNSSSNGIADNGDGADTASLDPVHSCDSVAEPPNSKTMNSSTAASVMESVDEYGKSPNSINQKRKDNQSNGKEVSKKLKSSIDLLDLSSLKENSNERGTKLQIMELERVVSKQANNLKAVLASNVELQEALEKMNMGENLSKERAVHPNTGFNQTAPRITTANEVAPSPPVSPITREDAIIFSSVVEYQLATFSGIHYMNASRNSSFLVNKPIGIDNPGRIFCYMNSVVQALSCIPLFAVNLVCAVESVEGSLLHALYQTYKHVWVRRPDAWNNNRPSKLNTNEIRSYYAQYHGIKFDPTRQHDAQEFLEDLISNLESEMSEQCGGVEEENVVTRMFRGYIVAPDGTKEYFRNLRLSIEDERVDSVESALLYHLHSWSPRSLPLVAPVAENSSSSNADVDQEENAAIREKTDVASQVETEKNEPSLHTASRGETEDVQMPSVLAVDHDAKPKSRGSTQTIAASEGTVDGDLNQNLHSVLDEFFFGNPFTREAIRIYTPDILCISLNRHKFDYSFNNKVLPAEDLTIPADLRAPEGMKLPARYKLMSIVQYVPVGSSAGHYYTFIMSGKGVACMLNDESLTCVEIDKPYLAALDARSSIFVYARVPDCLQREPGSI